MPAVLATNWWALALRGVVAILLGIFTFLLPGITLGALVLLFGAYALIDGVLNLIAAWRAHAGQEHWWVLVFEGIAGIAAGITTFLWPAITTVVLVFLIAAWAIVTGVFEIAAAIRLRKVITGEWVLALLGIISIMFGVFIAAAPIAGALAIALWFGIYAFAFGILMVFLAFRLRGWERSFGTESLRQA
jgi:uncharacterized membrane protein HdeD (DUF308 family)